MKTQLEAPMLRLALCFGGGIFLHTYISPFWLFYLSASILALILLASWGHKLLVSQFEWAASICISLLFLCLGTGFFQAHTYSPIEQGLERLECTESVLAGKVISPRKKTPFGYQAWVELLAFQKDSLWIRAKGKFQLYLKPELDSLFEEGDEVMIHAFVKPVLQTGKAYHKFLLSKEIRHFAYAKGIRVSGQDSSFSFWMRSHRRYLSQTIEEQIEDSVLVSLAQAMFLGEKQDLRKETRAAFASAGLSHMLAISGMHVGIIFVCLNLIFLPFNLFIHGKRIKQGCILLLLLGYMLLTGSSPAVVRAVLMLSTVLLFRILYTRYSLVNLLAISAWMQMLYDPTVVFQVGFQLSYAAVLGLLIFMPIYQQLTETPYRWLNTLNGWIGVSLIATCCTAPLSIFYFEQFPVYFLLSNLLASTLAFGLILSGFLWLICMWIPYVSDIFASICEFFLWTLHLIATEISQLPFALISEFFWSHKGVQIVLLELVMAILFICLPRLYFNKKLHLS